MSLLVRQPLTTVLLDLDGVVYVEDEPVPGAREAIERMRRAGVTLRFVTNTTSLPRAATLSKLARLGIDVGDDELITPAALALRHCRARGHRRAMLLMDDDVKGDFMGLEATEHEPDAVVVGDLGERFDYDVLNRAFRHLLAGAELIALQKNRYWLRDDGLSLDVGPFVAALEYAADCEAHVVGKPAAAFFVHVLEGAGADPGEAVMVGDDIESDIAGALRAGIASVLVRTGKYREAAVLASGIQPTATVDSLVDLPALLRSSPLPE
ncbi:MAG TPA: TIGR01458 family HAD-type hydrolase [Thermoleophilaceae bacterium]|nr:TIGR01458 family HAD-type hydrolase [Thermoleophilaceae bacterium]